MDFSKSKLYSISNKKYLSELLGVEKRKLKNVDKYFTVKPFTIVSNKKREVYNPSRQHKNVLRKILNFLSPLTFPNYIYGSIPNSSYIVNASHHLSSKYFLLTDIENFYPSTSDSYVYDFFFNKMKMSTDIAKILVDLTTVKSSNNKRFLPQGYPTSPILSVLAYFDMYKELNMFSSVNNLKFSAYVDDFTFSSINFIHPNKKNKINSIINKYGLKINKGKTKLLKTKSTKITGVIIEGNKRKAPNKAHKNMFESYLKILDMDKYPFSYNKDDFIKISNSFHGYVYHLQSIEGAKYQHYINTLKYFRKKYDIPIDNQRKNLHFKKIQIPD